MMWCKVMVILPVFLAGWVMHCEAFGGISSFGKANTEPPKPVTPATAPARACTKQAECIAVPSSSCVRTHYDPQTRCLCGDNSSPINGQCEAQGKTLYHACANSDECLDGMSCGPVNATDRPPHLRMWGPKDTICLCDTENGFREKDHSCSESDETSSASDDADILKTSVFAILIVSCIRKLLVY